MLPSERPELAPRSPADGLDAGVLQRLADLDPGGAGRLVERVLQTYAESLVRLLAQARAGRDAGDWDAVRLAAHTLRSSSGSVGALRLAEVCDTVERTAQRIDAHVPAPPAGAPAERLARLDALVDELGDEAQRALAAVEAWRAGGGRP